MKAPERALVTGASGFIGLELCRRLQEQGTAVRALLRSECAGPWDEAVTGELPDRLPGEAVEGVDTVFHLASRVHALSEIAEDEHACQRVNVEGTRALVEAAVVAGVRRLVYFSSVKASGEGGHECVDETGPDAPLSAYGRSKLAAEEIVLAAGREGGAHAVCLRPPMVYGPGGRGNLTRLLQAVARGRFPPFPETGNRRSMVHVRDVVQAALLAAGAPAAAGRRYYVTDARPYSTGELYVLACRALDRPIPAWRAPLALLRGAARAGDLIGRLAGRRFVIDTHSLTKLTGSACYSCARIGKDVGYRPTITLPEALPEMVADLRARGLV